MSDEDIILYERKSITVEHREDYDIWLVGLTEASATSEGYQPSNFDIIPNFVPKTQIHDFTVIDKIENGANSEDLHIIDLDAVAHELLDEILKKSAYLDEWKELVIIGHSLGEIIIKRAIILAQENPRYLKLIFSLSCVIFITNGHESSTILDFKSTILNMLPSKRRTEMALYKLAFRMFQISEDFSIISPQYQTKNFGVFPPGTNVKDFLTRELAKVKRLPSNCHEFLAKIATFRSFSRADLKHDISKSNEPQAVEILELIRKAPSKISIIHVVGCLGSGKTTTVLSVAKRIQKEGVAIVVRYFKGFSTTLPDPVPALLATFLYETLVQRPDLFPRIQYFVQHFSKQLHVDTYIRLLTHALLKLNFVTFVVLIDDFDSWSPLSVALLTTLHRLAISANSNIKFVVSSESRDIAFTGQVDRTIELDKGKPRSLALEADYSDLFRTRPSLEVYKDQICEKVLEMESSAISPYLILKVLSRLSDVSTPSGLLRHLSFMCFDTRMIYTYYIEDLNTKPLEMVSWSFAALSWIYRGFRPLLENEIGCAAAIAYNPGAASALNKYISIDALDRYAGAFIRKEHDYILPFHESTKVFLLSNPIFSKSSLDGTHLRTDAELTTLSLKYISDFILDVFPRKRYTADGSPSLILPSIPEHQFLDYTCRFWPDHYLRASETIEKDDAENLDQCVLTFLENSLVRQAWHEVYKTQLPSLSPQKVYEPTPLRISCDLGLTRVALKIITDSQTVLDMSELDFALDQAVKSSHAEIVDCLLGLKVKGHFALAYAAQRDDCSLIKRIINNDANINAIDNLGSTAMHVAAKAGSLDACKTLHSLGASIGKLDSNMNSILHLACEGGSEDIVKWLVQAEISVPVNEKNRFGETPLHLAAAFGHAEVVNQLMLSYADVSPKDKHGRMPLDLACENGHLDVMIYLLDESHPRLNPFQFAAKSGCVLTLKTIISDLPNAEKFVQKENALFLATSYDKENAVEYLLQCGADPNKPDVLSPDKMTPLAKAAAMGFTRIIRRLVVAGADVNLLSGINNGSPLHHAASCYQTRAIFELLIVSNHDINAKDGKKQTPLHLAAEKGMKESVKLLLRRGADGDLGDCMGYNALHLAAREGHLPVVDFMISEEYGSIEAITKSGMTALHVAASAGQLEVVRFLISKSLKLIPRLAIGGNQRPSTNLSPSKNPEFVNAKAYCGQTSLHFAASNRQLEVAKLLLASRASNLVDRQGRSALHAASVKGNSDLVKLLLENNFDINLQDNHGDTPVFIAACRGADDIVQQLVQSGADVSLKNSAGWSPLHAAFGYKVITEYLISCKEVDINDKENTGRTALMIAAQNNHPDVVEFLVNAGANLSDQNKDGLTALHFAADQNHPSCLKLLLWEKANIHQRDGQKRTCLRLAASTSRGDLASLAILLSTEDTLDGFRVNWSYDELLEALLGAAEAGNSGAVMRLLREDREILNGRLTNGCTAMETALKHKWIETALLLLSNGGKPWSCGGPYISSIHLALACNQNADEFITAATERGVNPTASDAFSFLRLALEFERNDIWHKFEDYRENTLEILDSDGWTLNDFLLQAKNPVHATLTSSHKPDAVVVPKTWAYEMTVDNSDNFSLTIDKKGLEVQLSNASNPISLRANYPFPPRSPRIDYFEVKILEWTSEFQVTSVAIGVCGEFSDLGRCLCGENLHSIGYHDNGIVYDFSTIVNSHQSFGKGAIVGCGIDWNTDEFFFTLNGQLAYRGKGIGLSRKLYPVISMQGGTVKVRVEFVREKFQYQACSAGALEGAMG